MRLVVAFTRPHGSVSSGKDEQVALRSRRVAAAVGFPSVAEAEKSDVGRDLQAAAHVSFWCQVLHSRFGRMKNREIPPSFASKHSAFCMVSAPSVLQSCETLHFDYRIVVQCGANTIFCNIMSPHSRASFCTVIIKEGLPSAAATGISRIQGCRVALLRHLKVSPRRWLLHQIGIRHDLFAIRIPTRRVE